MSAINHAIQDVVAQIPPRILKLAFQDRLVRYRQVPVSVEQQIRQHVIVSRVLRDANVVGGTEILVELDKCERTFIDELTYVYRVPKEMTGGRSIISAKSINFMNPNTYSNLGSVASCNRGELALGASNMMNAMANMPPISTASLTIIGENTVAVTYTASVPGGSWLRCIVDFDSDLSTLNIRNYIAFSKLVLLATKAYIYNNTIIELESGQLEGGVSIGITKSIIEEYRDSNELYFEHLNSNMGRIFMLNDSERKRRFMSFLVGGPR